MDGRRFRLVVHGVKKLNGFCTVADGVVEGGAYRWTIMCAWIVSMERG